jgi:hypothetical protein
MFQSSHEDSGSSRENQSPRDDDRCVNAASDGMTLLTIALGEMGVVRKTIGADADGRLRVDETQPFPTWFRVECARVANFAALEHILETVQRRGDTVAIRGTYHGARPGYTRRLGIHFHDLPVWWLGLDFDSIPCPPRLDWPNDLPAVLRYLRSLLPAPFHGVRMWGQATGRACVKPGIRARAFCLLSRPLSSPDAGALLADAPVDHALYRVVQQHYIALPHFVPPARDPVPVRSAVIEGEERVPVPHVIPHGFRPTSTGRQGGSPRSGYASSGRQELRDAVAAAGGRVVPGVRSAFATAGERGSGRHNLVLSTTGYLIARRWPTSRVLELLTPLANEHFGDGDWRREVEAAVAHAEKRQAESPWRDFGGETR